MLPTGREQTKEIVVPPWLWPYLLTAVGVAGMWLAGKRRPSGWVVNLGAETLWAIYATVTHQWGFYASVVAYTLVYAKNYRAWRE